MRLAGIARGAARGGEASQHFVDMFELQRGVERDLANCPEPNPEWSRPARRVRWQSATAGCIAGSDPKNIWQLPDTTGLKNEVVMLGGRSAFDSAIRLAGGKLVIANGVEDLHSAITPQTAMVYTTWRDDRLPKALSRSRGGRRSPPAGRCSRNSSI